MKNRIRLTVKMLAFVMSVLILIASLPVSSIASAIYNDTGDTSTENTSENADIQLAPKPKDVIVLEEDEALREENIKHFKLSDGTTKAVVYTQPVHYKDSNGKWIDIDNALTLNGSEYSTNNKSEIKFANKSGSSGLVSIKDGKYKIDFTPSNTNKVSVVIENPQSNNSRKFEDLSVLNNLVSKAIYTNIYDGIDIEYVLVGNNIKENIIVKEKQDSYTYTFELKLNNLSAELVNGAIILCDYDSDEQVYEIPAPYMLDANNEYSNSVEYSLVQNSKWKYTLIVTANPEWINAEERVFPVTIDPTVGVPNNSIIYKTAYYDGEMYPDNQLRLRAGYDYRAYVQSTSMPVLPNDAYITNASISLYHISGSGCYIGVYRVLDAWNELSEYGGSLVDSPTDYNYIIANEDGTFGNDGWFTWDITEIAHTWYTSNTMYGVAFEAIEGESNITFVSNNSIVLKPVFTISYRDMKGTEPYWSYTSQNAGIAGTGSINLKTGNLMFAVPTLTTTDSLFGFTPTLIYNSAIAGQDYIFANAQVSYIGAYAPKGFKFNGHETLMKSTHLDTEGTSKAYYVWTDGDGTEHYFYEIGQNTNVYIDEDGLQCTLIISNNEAQLTDANHNVRTFEYLNPMFLNNVTEAWYLTSISDKNNNKLSFVLNNDKNPTAINVTPNGQNPIEMLTIEYSDSSRINLVWNKTSGEARLLRYSDTPTGELSATGGAYLREMLFLHCDNTVTSEMLQAFVGDTDNVASGITVDAVATYEYDSDGYLIKATDNLSDYSIEYTIGYYSKKITDVKEYGKNQTQGQRIGLTYYQNYTMVRSSGSDDTFNTSDDLINIYTFDNLGRTVSTYTTDSTRTEIYGAVTGEYETEVEKAKNSLAMSTVINGNSANYLLNGNFEASDSSVLNWARTSNTSLNIESGGVAWNNAKLNMNATPGGTTYIHQTIKLSKGTYTMSLDINAQSSSNFQIYLKAISSNNTFIEEVPVNEIYASGSGGFASFTFEVDETTATNYTVGVFLVANSSATSTDRITVDNIMLAKTTGMSQYNYVNYADLENYVTGSGLGKWSLTTGAAINNLAYTTIGNSIAITGSISEKRSASQTIYTASQAAIDRFTDEMTYGSGATNEDTVFIISGFGKATSAMPTSKSRFAVVLDVKYRSATDEQIVTEEIVAEFHPAARDWQFASSTFILPANSFIEEITVRCEYSNNIGTAYFDNITLTYDKNGDTTRYSYNGDGKLEAEFAGATDFTFYAYENGDLTNVISPRSHIVYSYNENHNLASETHYYHTLTAASPYETVNNLLTWCENNQVLRYMTLYISNEYGLISYEGTYHDVEGECIVSNYNYDIAEGSKLFGSLKRKLGNLNEQTEYFYYKDGKLGCVRENDGTGYYYSYDGVGNLIGVYPLGYNETFANFFPDTSSTYIQYEFDDYNCLEKIIANGTTYNFTYDEFGNQESVSIGNSQIVSQETNARNGKVAKVTYANGTTVEYTYDHLNRVIEIKYTNGTIINVYNYEYDSKGNLCKSIDNQSGTTTIYKYDASGRLVKMIEYDTEEMKNNFGVSYQYDEESRLQSMYYYNDYLYNSTAYANLSNSYIFTYSIDNSLKRLDIKLGGSRKYRISYTYDDFSRYANKVIDFGNIDNTTTYNYLSSSNATSALISQYTTTVTNDTETISTQTFSYTYDAANQNITEIRNAGGNLLYRYTYDSLDRLIREDNSVTNKTYVYTYDNNGNFLSEKVYSYTTGSVDGLTPTVSNTYTYGNTNWGDQLTSYNGNAITYDNMGNPLTYYNSLRFEWGNVNNLISINEGAVTYTYNDNGIRTSKTVNGVTHTYHLDGTRILSEEYGNKLILYIYDEAGGIIGMAYRTNSYASGVFDYYLFTKNLQGDIIGIYDTNGNCVASYKYNAWGECTVTNHTTANIGNINPFRYRGYYYDTETGFYYLNARYYDPQIKRFLNPDTFDNLGANGDLNSFNLYAYCSNNPVMYVDPTGEIAGWVVAIIVVVAVVAIINTKAVAITNIEADNNDVAAMDDETFAKYDEERETTAMMSRDEQIAYIRRIRQDNPVIAENWSEAQMIRELRYHEALLPIAISFESDPFEEGSLTYRLNHVGFEEEQTFKTYFRRIIGNVVAFW